MPTYDYECRSCGHRIEVIHSMTEDGPSVCERCGGALRRVLHPAGIIFKGSGFYSTDSRSSSSASKAATSTKADGESKKGSSTDGGPTASGGSSEGSSTSGGAGSVRSDD